MSFVLNLWKEKREMGDTKCNKDGWVKKKLGEVCEIIMGQSPSSESYNYEENGLPFFQGCSDFGLLYPNEKVYCSSPNKIAEAKDVLISVRAPVGTLNIANKHCCIGRGLAAIRCDNSSMNYKFIYYFLEATRPILEMLGTGAVFKSINKKQLNEHRIEVPSYKKQIAIVSELDCLNGIIEKQKEQLKQLDELAQSIFYDMFGDPVENEKGWNKKKFKEFGTIISGYAFQSGSFVEEGIPVLKIGNINSGQLSLENVSYYMEDKSLTKYEVYPNDMVISLTGTVGKDDYGNVCILPNTCQKYYLNQRNAKLVTDKDCEILFLKFLFKDYKVKNELTRNSRGVRQANISNKDIYDLLLILPPLPLQQAFASKIEAIEHQKELIKKSIAETETLFNSRMDYYFG